MKITTENKGSLGSRLMNVASWVIAAGICCGLAYLLQYSDLLGSDSVAGNIPHANVKTGAKKAA